MVSMVVLNNIICIVLKKCLKQLVYSSLTNHIFKGNLVRNKQPQGSYSNSLSPITSQKPLLGNNIKYLRDTKTEVIQVLAREGVFRDLDLNLHLATL